MWRKRDKASISGRKMAKGREQLQRDVEQRLGYWRLFLEAKLQEVKERRNPGGLFTDVDRMEHELCESLLRDVPPVVVEEAAPPAVVEDAEPEPKHQRLF